MSPRLKILLLVHRVPFPPNRGDRVRSWQLVKWLSERSELDLACLADEPVTGETTSVLQSTCRRVAIERVGGWSRWANAARSLACGRTATEGLFASRRLRRCVDAWSQERRYDAAVVFCSSMAPYLDSPGLRGVPTIVDFVDVDSQKWLDYAMKAHGIKRTLFHLEHRRMRGLEQAICRRSAAVAVVSKDEARLLADIDHDANVHTIENGVDLEYFDAAEHSSAEHSSEQSPDNEEIVFVGALDYRANVDGVVWFCEHVWPQLRIQRPNVRLALVGRRPTPAVSALGKLPGVSIAADVPDVRPYLSRASIAIAPLRIARGIQNKVLEAAAMAKAVVASPQALQGLEFQNGEHACRADAPAEWVAVLDDLLASAERRARLGRNARALVVERYRWEARLAPLAAVLSSAVATSTGAASDRAASDRAASDDVADSAQCAVACGDV